MSDPERDPPEGEQERDPFEELAGEENSIGDPFAELGDGVDEDAAGGAGEDVAEGAGEDAVGGTGEDAVEDPFEEVDEGEPIEDVWETLGDDAADGESTLAPVDDEDGPREEIVDKRAFCQRCRYLSEPPAVHCTHEGTEILEVLDNDRFRVRGCPMVDRGGPESDTR